MNLRTPRRLTLLALIAPSLALLPTVTAAPVSAARGDSVSPAYVVDEWTDGDHARLPALPYSRVELTYDASYGITLDGQVRTSVASWKDSGQRALLTAPAFDRPIIDVTGGTSFGLGLDDQGRLRSWGSAPEIPAEDLAETYRDLAAVGNAAVGVTSEGQLRFWGTAASRYVFDPAALAAADVASVDINSAAAVAMTADGHVLSAGYALDGTYFESAPLPAERADDVYSAVDVGVNFALGLTQDGEIVSWGSYQNGEDQVPELPVGRHAVAVSAGMQWAAAVLDDGSVVTWGNRERTELPPLRADLPVVDVDLDRYHSAVTYAALANTAAPTISGVPEFGTELTATPGEWSSTPDDLHYAWTLHAHGTTKAVGTDAPSYTPTAQDALDWGTLSVTVTAEKDGFLTGTATSAETDHVAQRQFATAPTLNVQGTPQVGGTLTAVTTVASPAPDDVEVTWFRSTEEGEEFSEKVGDGATLALTADLLGADVVANVTAYKEGYEPASDESEPITVTTGTLIAPTVSITGRPRVGQVLTATASAPAAATATSYQWLRAGAPITGATARTYRPATADLGRRLSVRVVSSAPGYTAATATSAATAAVSLGAVRLKITVPAKATVGKKATITVRGLAGGERFTVTVAGKRLTGKATAAGVGKVALKVAGKPGNRAVKAVGSVADRSGTATLRVVRRK
ncbi:MULTISPECIES: hypothetical protein [unclassified Nocardioides]|uniref:hypothetical protein n=1 Tax=unclassified Nocardioides TaxID=2615069 RepID=UPI0030148FAD